MNWRIKVRLEILDPVTVGVGVDVGHRLALQLGGMRLGELEGVVGDEGGYTAEADAATAAASATH